MNDFSKFMADSFGVARDVAGMGDPVVLNGFSCTAVTMRVAKSSAAAVRGGGRVVSVSGAIEVSVGDWRASGARRGSIVEHPDFGVMKVTNDPNESLSVVTLEVAGESQ